MSKPRIGISTKVAVHAGPHFVGYRRIYTNDDYVQAVLAGGGIPVVLPLIGDPAVITDMVGNIDGLVLMGGNDVDPALYGEEPQTKLGGISIEQDTFDTALYHAAAAGKKPVLGICRGAQLINVLNGGTLYQDMSYAKFSSIKHNQEDHPRQPIHAITIEKGSRLYDIYGATTRVNSFHHQCIKDVAANFTITARSKDGVPESIEHTGDTFILGIQWHPEMMSQTNTAAQKIFTAFIAATAQRME